jgi:hypothetical protein
LLRSRSDELEVAPYLLMIAFRKVLARQSGLAIEDQDGFEILSEGKDTSRVSRLQRRVVIDSDDEDKSKSLHYVSYVQDTYMTLISTISAFIAA